MKKVFFVFLFMILWLTPSWAQAPLPAAPQIERVRLHPWPVMTVPVGEPATIAIDVVLGNGEHKSDLRNIPVRFRIDGNAEMFCSPENGMCAVRSNQPGTVTFQVTSDNGVWGYRWVYIIFVPQSTVPGFLQSVDTLVVTFNTNQVATGDVLTGTVTFPRSVPGPVDLRVSIDRLTRVHYFPNGVKRGQRFTFMEKRANPLDDNYIFARAELISPDRSRIVYATGQGATEWYRSINVDIDEDAGTIRIFNKYGSRTDDYRVMITRGSDFILEIPVRRFDLLRGTELYFFSGMFGYDVTIPDGRYTVSLLIRDRQTGWEYPKFEANGFEMESTMRLK